MLRETLSRIAQEYPAASRQTFKEHTLAKFVRRTVPMALAKSDYAKDLKIIGSVGKGQWTFYPWIAFLDPAASSGPQNGYYIVYLFSDDFSRVHLSLNQGTHSIQQEFKSLALPELEARAKRMRYRLKGMNSRLNDTEIEIALDGHRHAYEAGHALGKSYEIDSLPAEADLKADLLEAILLYRSLTLLGGNHEIEFDDVIEGEELSVVEKRHYTTHRKIERRADVSKKVKHLLGHSCMACGFNYQSTYGDIGTGYIEAHHLVPLASLEIGESVSMDLKKDFVVLCANCHRMAHRRMPPYSLEELRAMLQ